MPAERSYLGQGLGFPPRIGSDGGFSTSSGYDNIRDSIRVVLLTDVHERVMLPGFGAGLGRFLFRPNTVATHRLIEEAIKQSLAQWELRIAVKSIAVAKDAASPTSATATIRYQVVADQVTDQVSVNLEFLG